MPQMSKADNTRMDILKRALPLVYKNGYQATSVDDIIATTKVTKGAFYYHFKNKDKMGLAIIKDVMYPAMRTLLIKPLLDSQNPQKEIYQMMEKVLMDDTFFDIKYGCPAVNLIEEMSPLNSEFANLLTKLFIEWKIAIVGCLNEGKKANTIKPNLNSEQVAVFILSGYSGIRNLGKILGKSSYTEYLKELKNYLTTLN